MPRAGSTLLQNVFAQNPDIYATPTSGVLELTYAARAMYSESNEFQAQDTKTMENGLGFRHESGAAHALALHVRSVLSKLRQRNT